MKGGNMAGVPNSSYLELNKYNTDISRQSTTSSMTGGKKHRMKVKTNKLKIRKRKTKRSKKLKNKTKKMRIKKMKGGNFLMDSNMRLPTNFATTGGTTMTYNLLHNQPMTDNKVYNHNIQSDVMKI